MTTIQQRLLRLDEVCELLGCKASKLYDMIRKGQFPAGLKLFGRASRWQLADVENFITTLPRGE